MLSQQVTIRRMCASDLASVLEIERESFKLPWSSYAFLETLARPDSYSIVAEANEPASSDEVHLTGLVGYAMSVVLRDIIHVINLAVKRGYRRQGIGSQLLRDLLDYGSQLGKERARLEVRVSNTPAICLYERFGFWVVEARRRYYPDGEDVLIMETLLRSQQGKKQPERKRSG